MIRDGDTVVIGSLHTIGIGPTGVEVDAQPVCGVLPLDAQVVGDSNDDEAFDLTFFEHALSDHESEESLATAGSGDDQCITLSELGDAFEGTALPATERN
jgi:hypothetical protein